MAPALFMVFQVRVIEKDRMTLPAVVDLFKFRDVSVREMHSCIINLGLQLQADS